MSDGRCNERIHRVSSVWKSYLYQLQQQAPKPAAVLCTDRPPDCPSYYNLEYHGAISQHRCQGMLSLNGSYLVRRSKNAEGFYTLSLRFDKQVKHYRLYYDGEHYVGEKRFDTLHGLVADGLVAMYMEEQAGEYLKNMSAGSYVNSPHYTLTRSMRRHIHTGLSGKFRRHEIIEPAHEEEKSTFYVNTPSAQLEDVNLNVDSGDITTQRPHRFNVHTFTGLHWCGFCGHFLWGFVSQGVRCQDCCFKAHKQCSYKVPNDCCPDLKDLQSLFGADLTTSLNLRGGTADSVPSVVTECIAEVEARGLTVEGIYRVPGSQDQIDTLRLAFERDGDRVSLNEKALPDINVVAGVLKLYLRLLPIPLITTQCFNRLVGTCKLTDREARVTSIRDSLLTLPPAHYATLKAIISHLARVCEHSAVNKMTATSLSTIFAPTLVQTDASTNHLQPADLLALVNAAQEPRVVEGLIIFHHEVFQ